MKTVMKTNKIIKKKAVVMNRECCVEKCNKAKEDYDEGSDDKSSVV